MLSAPERIAEGSLARAAKNFQEFTVDSGLGDLIVEPGAKDGLDELGNLWIERKPIPARLHTLARRVEPLLDELFIVATGRALLDAGVFTSVDACRRMIFAWSMNHGTPQVAGAEHAEPFRQAYRRAIAALM